MTTREFAQTLELLELHGIEHSVVGPAHGGAGVIGKARATGGDASQRCAASRRPRASISRWRTARTRLMLAARSLGIPSATAHDYEFATLQHHLGLRAATARRLPRRGSRRAPRPPRCPTAEACPLPRDRGGVLPRGLRARSGRDRRHRSGKSARGRPHAAGHVALPPARQPNLRRRPRAARPRRVRARGRAASNNRAARGDPRSRPCVAARPGARCRRPESRRASRPHRLGRRDDESRGRGPRYACLHDVHRTARSGRRDADCRGATPTARGRKRSPGTKAGGRRHSSRSPRSAHLARCSPFDTPGIRTAATSNAEKEGFLHAKSSRRSCARSRIRDVRSGDHSTQRQFGVQDITGPDDRPRRSRRVLHTDHHRRRQASRRLHVRVDPRRDLDRLEQASQSPRRRPQRRQAQRRQTEGRRTEGRQGPWRQAQEPRQRRDLRQPRDLHRSVPLQRHDRCRLQRLHERARQQAAAERKVRRRGER